MVKLLEENTNETEENIAKKLKTEDSEVTKSEIVLKPVEPKPERCLICRQYSNELLVYNGHPNNSVEEYIALTDEKLQLFTGDEANVHEHDTRPTHKVSSTAYIFGNSGLPKVFSTILYSPFLNTQKWYSYYKSISSTVLEKIVILQTHCVFCSSLILACTTRMDTCVRSIQALSRPINYCISPGTLNPFMTMIRLRKMG